MGDLDPQRDKESKTGNTHLDLSYCERRRVLWETLILSATRSPRYAIHTWASAIAIEGEVYGSPGPLVGWLVLNFCD